MKLQNTEKDYKTAYQFLYHSVGTVMDRIQDGKFRDMSQIRQQLYDAMVNADDKLVFTPPAR